jgi:hypothetical protein
VHRHHHHHCPNAPRNELLLAIDNVNVALTPRRRLERRNITASVRLGDSETHDFLARDHVARHLVLEELCKTASAVSGRAVVLACLFVMVAATPYSLSHSHLLASQR